MTFEPEFSASLSRDGDVLSLRLTGELDLATVPELEAALPRPAAGEVLVIDLRNLSFIDSTGIHVLMGLDVSAREQGWSFALVRPGPDVQRVLDLCHVGDRVRFVDRPTDASPALG